MKIIDFRFRPNTREILEGFARVFKANIEAVQKMIADKTDKEKVVDFIISNRKGDIKKILMEVL